MPPSALDAQQIALRDLLLRLGLAFGADTNAFTSFDYTAYFQTVAVDRLEQFMEMEADRMINLVLTEKVVETEKAVVLEERRSRTDNNPSSILREQVSS